MKEQRLVLLIDDDAYIRHILRRHLEACGYRVDEVDSGERALEAVRSLQPDLVLLDVIMPGISGLEVCARLKADPVLGDTPVLFLSSSDDIGVKTAGFELGGQDYMTKSADLREIRLRVKAAMSAKIEREVLQEAANRLENERRQLQHEALVDPLTGLANRRAMMETGVRTLEEARFTGRPVSLWVLDVDNFKRVNDTWGHAVGDKVLKLVGTHMQFKLREGDVCARHGGEEFTAIFAGTDLEDAVYAAERVRASIEKASFPIGSGRVHVTVSIGVASFPVDGQSLDTLLEVADRRLYAAKQGGRNRVATRPMGEERVSVRSPNLA